jgi:hypothetical protein
MLEGRVGRGAAFLPIWGSREPFAAGGEGHAPGGKP